MTALSTIFRRAQKPGLDALRSVTTQCAEELAKVGIRVHEIWNLPPPPKQGVGVVIGAAFYSLHDLQLIDSITAKWPERHSLGERLEIFDVLSCKTQADFEACMHGIGKVFQTPVAGIWRDGALLEKASGRNAAELIRKHYNLSVSVLD